ncbi:hypothetical protein X801_00491 [Opisthorchis viverrini]|uniref:Uncharacterized protein n=2 Tax=Opisthorchis viverrini TaxID=6198 RepID=A0A1S8XA68_OPIVI|nr:hypothetical protein T265_04146 [Opisthorchis viverrini]KER29134.1 hypothetical protein T265_04146 [Opisthorchis viverrini]OON23588.1 hypothetical protein X801_00491 [Opisthorchis viverrini]
MTDHTTMFIPTSCLKLIFVLISLGVFIYCANGSAFIVPVKYDERGLPFVEYGEHKYPIKEDRDINFRDENGCTVHLDLRLPTMDEMEMETGFVQGSLLCLRNDDY